MPRRTKRRRRRRRSKRQINTVVIRGPAIFPDRVFVRLKYTNSFAVSTSALNTTRMSGNSLHRPDYQALSQQVRGFDQWMAIYGRYKVHKSTIRVQVINLGAAANIDAVVLPDRGNPSFIDTEDAREQPYAKSKRLSPLSGPTGAISIFNGMKTRTIYGTKVDYIDFSADAASNPPQEWDWYVYLQNLTNDSGVVNCDVSVSMMYYVELNQRNFIPRSED